MPFLGGILALLFYYLIYLRASKTIEAQDESESDNLEDTTFDDGSDKPKSP